MVIVINEKDNVAVALLDIAAGAEVVLPDGGRFEAVNDVPYSHKVALIDIAEGGPVIKYGESIGEAAREIRKGECVHTHNLKSEEAQR